MGDSNESAFAQECLNAVQHGLVLDAAGIMN